MSVLWILGEAKSGKSELGEGIFARLPAARFYIGTLLRTPDSMHAISRHVASRPTEWATVEVTDSLSAATHRLRGTNAGEPVAVLLDGWAVYLERSAVQWGQDRTPDTEADELEFVERLSREFRELVSACRHLIVVDHISPYPPTKEDYRAGPVRWRMRAVVRRCIGDSGEVIYHDREDVTHEDEAYVRHIANTMTAPG
jgi:adenosyl cobinamide kinase/adenosyl cobinamide phosphate guanylyltransferase